MHLSHILPHTLSPSERVLGNRVVAYIPPDARKNTLYTMYKEGRGGWLPKGHVIKGPEGASPAEWPKKSV